MIQLIALSYGWLAVGILLEIHHESYLCMLPDDDLHPYDVEIHCIAQNRKCDQWLAVANELHSKLKSL